MAFRFAPVAWVVLAAFAGCLPSKNDDLGDEGTDTESTSDESDDASDDSNVDDSNGDSDHTDDDSTGDGGSDSDDSNGDDGSDSGDSDGDDSGDTGGVACPGRTHACVDPAPDGWNGPIVVELVDEDIFPTDCIHIGGYPEDVFRIYDIGSHPFRCSCDCRDPMPTGCDSVSLRHWGEDVGGCDGDPSSIYEIGGSCTDLPNTMEDGVAGYFSIEPADATGGSCTPNETDDNWWNRGFRQLTGCTGATPLSAECPGAEQQCLPFLPRWAYDNRFCIWRDGTEECPDGPYGEAMTYYREYTDTRACTDCTCGEYSGDCGSGVVLSQESGSCDSPIAEALTCTHGQSVRSARHDLNPTGGCEPSEVMPVGETSKSDPVSVCCYGPVWIDKGPAPAATPR